MKKTLLFGLLLLGGCYATASPMYLPDGSSGYRITCGDYIGVTADCIQKAGDICGPNGYQMYDQTGHPLGEQTQNQTVIAALNSTPQKSRSSSSSDQSAMFIKCKGTQAPMSIITPPPVEQKPLPASPALSAPATAPDNRPIPINKN